MIEFVNEYFNLFVLGLLAIICILILHCFSQLKRIRLNVEDMDDYLKDIHDDILKDIRRYIIYLRDVTFGKILKQVKSIKKIGLNPTKQTPNKDLDGAEVYLEDGHGVKYKLCKQENKQKIEKIIT